MHPHLAVFTATATRTTKGKIFELFQLNLSATHVMEQDTVRDNIKFAVRYIDHNKNVETIFNNIIYELKITCVKTEGTLIFCKTRKHCSLIYRAFEESLGKKMYIRGQNIPEERIVEMFHAGTPSSVKDHIVNI